MALHQYLCPTCGVALQSPRDVAGKAVRCLGCQAAFTARPAPTVAKAPPPPVAIAHRPPGRPRAADPRPASPPIPRERQVPAAVFVVGGAGVLAVGLTLFLVIRFRDRPADRPPTPAIAERPVAATPPIRPEAGPQLLTPAEPPLGQRVEEEEVAAVPGTKGPPDLSSLLPDLPRLVPTAPKPADRPARPRDQPPAEPTEPPAMADGPIPPALLGKLKAATVFIQVSAGAVRGTGSGFVLRVDGDTALVVTNDHVVHPTSRGGRVAGAAQYECVFHSGRKNEFALKADLVAAEREHDLAVLRVRGVQGRSDFPTALDTTAKAPVAETMPIYIFGFPFGEMLATGKGNPAVTIGKGTISSLREDDTGDTAFIQIDGDVNPGNSGGPVVDARGRLVGVTVAKLTGTNIGLAIPPAELDRMLGGRLGNLDFRVARSAGSAVEVDVRGNLVDPLDRLTAASLLVVRADELKEVPTVGAGGRWAALPGAARVDLRVAGHDVSGIVQLPVRAADRGEIEFYFQPACVDRDGRTTYFAPVSRTLREGTPDRPGANRPGGPPGEFPKPPPVPGFPQPPGGAGPRFPQPPGGVPAPRVPGRPGMGGVRPGGPRPGG